MHIPEADAEERFGQLKSALPSRTARRMSRLGLMLSHLIEEIGVDAETLVLYASAFGEGRTLETYLSSFPQASPLGFQSSIHPGGVEQALIFRQQPVREFFPITASESLPLALFRTLEQCPHAKRVLLLGGEEHASWLTQKALAAGDNFAFALLLEPLADDTDAQDASTAQRCHPSETIGDHADHTTAQAAADASCAVTHPKPVLGLLRTDATEAGSGPALPALRPVGQPATDAAGADTQGAQQIQQGETLADLCAAIETRHPIRFAHPDEGSWLLDWRR